MPPRNQWIRDRFAWWLAEAQEGGTSSESWVGRSGEQASDAGVADAQGDPVDQDASVGSEEGIAARETENDSDDHRHQYRHAHNTGDSNDDEGEEQQSKGMQVIALGAATAQSTETALEPEILSAWESKIQKWSQDGSLLAAAQEALMLPGEPQVLKDLISQWSAGDFEGIPEIVLLSGTDMNGALGAYALPTGKIYLNADWLMTATQEAIEAVLTEELGHNLDATLNATDTPGDEGEYFSDLLRGVALTDVQKASLRGENDHGHIVLQGAPTNAEFSVPAYEQIVGGNGQIQPGRLGFDPLNVLKSDPLLPQGGVNYLLSQGYTDASGNTYILGSYEVSATTTNALTFNPFIAKISSAGVVEYVDYEDPSLSTGAPTLLCPGQDGSLYIGATIDKANGMPSPVPNGITYGGISVDSNRSGFIRKLASDGSVAWTTLITGSDIYSYIQSIITDKDGNTYAYWGDYGWWAPKNLTKIDKNGNILWATMPIVSPGAYAPYAALIGFDQNDNPLLNLESTLYRLDKLSGQIISSAGTVGPLANISWNNLVIQLSDPADSIYSPRGLGTTPEGALVTRNLSEKELGFNLGVSLENSGMLPRSQIYKVVDAILSNSAETYVLLQASYPSNTPWRPGGGEKLINRYIAKFASNGSEVYSYLIDPTVLQNSRSLFSPAGGFAQQIFSMPDGSVVSGLTVDNSYGMPESASGPFVGFNGILSSSHRAGFVYKLDPAGNLAWTTLITGGDIYSYVQTILTDAVGNTFAIFGDDSYYSLKHLSKISIDGNLLWTTDLFSTANGSIKGLTSDGNLIIVGNNGSYNQNHIWIASSNTGAILKSIEIPGGWANTLLDAIGYPNGDLIVAGVSNSGAASALIARLDSNGNILWQSSYQFAGYSQFTRIQDTGNGNILAYGVDGNGQEQVINVVDTNFVIYGDGGNSLTGQAVANDVITTGAGNDQIFSLAGSDTITSGAGNDIVNAGLGNDLIIGGTGLGDDTYDGGDDIDTVKYTSAVNYSITVDLSPDQQAGFAIGDVTEIGSDILINIENVIGGNAAAGDFIYGSNFANDLQGCAGGDLIDGRGGDDRLTGGTGNDTLIGGEGSDTAVFSGNRSDYSISFDQITSKYTVTDNTLGRDGIDTISQVEYIQFQDQSIRVNTGAGTFSISGATTPNAPVVGNILTATNTTVDPDGNGTGGFTYSWQTSTNGSNWSPVGTNSSSYTVAPADEGKQIRLVVTYTDAQNFSESVTTSAGSVPNIPPTITGITVQGTQAILQFSEAINTAGLLASRFSATVGGAARTITGFSSVTGDPTKLSLTISGTAATSSQAVTISYTDLSPNNDTTGVVQDLPGNDMATTPTPINATTFSSAATVTTLATSYLNLILSGNAAINATGNANANTITGNSAVNQITGGAGNDIMNGGAGSDIYIISTSNDHTAAEIQDTGASGTDELRFSSTTAGQTLIVFAGDTGLEQVTIGTGTTATATTSGTTALSINATLAPNGLTITGNDGANTLTGTAFADTLIGNGGSDILNGLSGDDLLNGGAGNDTMNGGDGSDIYLIATSTDHAVAEIADNGISGTDELRFSSTTANQTLTVFAGDTGLERVVIGTGTAASASTSGTTALSINAAAAVNALTITGNDGANTLTGTNFADTLIGNGGNDILNGGLGNDILTGGAGADIFRFASALNGTTNVDRITDFTPTAVATTTDRIQLENTGAGLFNALPVGTLALNAFFSSTGITFTGTAQRILYQSTTGNLFYDADGSGSASASILFATLNTGLAINNTHFVVT